MTTLNLTTPIKDLFMVGPIYVKRLKNLGINTVEDILHHYPFRYDDFSKITPIYQVQIGDIITIRGQVLTCQNIFTKHGKKIQKAVVADNTGQIQIIWFNQLYLPRTLKSGMTVSFSGKVDWFNRQKTLLSPEYEIIRLPVASSQQPERNNWNLNTGSWKLVTGGFNTIHTGRLVPIYPETYGLSSKWLRSRIAPTLNQLYPEIPDWLPITIKQQNNLINLNDALDFIHFPNSQLEIEKARERLAFDELFLMHLRSKQQKKTWQKQKIAHTFTIDQEKILAFIASLPFTLTNSQNMAIKEIFHDLSRDIPMNRLLEGDVGSGKTVVAAITMYAAFLNGLQTVLMAPTEILANQHYQTLKSLLEPLGFKIGLITGSHKLKSISNQQLAHSTSSGQAINNYHLIIGTHAIIFNKTKLNNLGLVIIDEQHRFGVEQRAKLIKKGKTPHILTMTATPIPRTIALTLYGDLDLSVLQDMPKGRKIIKTWIVPPQKRSAAYEWIKNSIIKNQSQAFIVCPLIEESEHESMQAIKAVKVEFEYLKKEVFPNLKLGLLHGKIKAKDKEITMHAFKNRQIDILVSTPVVEVGIDIPNAAIMMIEGAERFGLAQLHQLRGRVGRSLQQSYCLLFTSNVDSLNQRRLKSMENLHSGFELAEIDLKFRGQGDLFGIRQHGFSKLKIASFNDFELIKKTENTAKNIINDLDKYPLLKNKLQNYTINLIEPN